MRVRVATLNFFCSAAKMSLIVNGEDSELSSEEEYHIEQNFERAIMMRSVQALESWSKGNRQRRNLYKIVRALYELDSNNISSDLSAWVAYGLEIRDTPRTADVWIDEMIQSIHSARPYKDNITCFSRAFYEVARL